MGRNKDKEKELALALYMSRHDITFKDIAEKVEVSINTITNWARLGGWDNLKTANATTRTATVKQLQETLSIIAKSNIEKANNGTFTKNDADIIKELTDSIETLQNGFNLNTYVSILTELMDFIPRDNQKLRSQMAELQMNFLHKKAADSAINVS